MNAFFKKRFILTTITHLSIICAFVVFFCLTACCGGSRNPKTNSQPDTTSVYIPLKYNMYIENSGSMAGYCNYNDEKALETLVGDYYDRISECLNEGDTITLNYINTSIVQSKETKDNFLSSIKGHCNAAFTKIDQMLDMMMSNMQENEVNILVSDYVFSTNKGNPATASSAITTQVSNQLKKKDFTVAMFKYMVNFNGKYYPGGIKCNKPLPVYIWVFGKDSAVKQISQLPYNTKSCGEFLLQLSKPVTYTIDAKNKRMVKGLSIEVNKWEAERKQNYYEFTINADFSGILLSENDILNKSIYKITNTSSSTFELANIFHQEDATYLLTIRTQKPSPAKLKISYPISVPQWVDDSNFTGNGIPSDSTTLNLKYLIDGVSKAFTNSNKHANYFEIEIELI